jgi:hypothetical protein
MVNASYRSFGLNRVWYSYSGLTVSSLAATITYKVVSSTGTPISGATVKIDGVTGVTNSSGIAVLPNVPLGTQTVTVTAPGYKNYTTTLPVSSTTTVQSVTLSTVTTPTPPPTPPPAPNYTGYYIAAVVIIIIVIVVAVWALRRK